jgi:hypothetical protein
MYRKNRIPTQAISDHKNNINSLGGEFCWDAITAAVNDYLLQECEHCMAPIVPKHRSNMITRGWPTAPVFAKVTIQYVTWLCGELAVWQLLRVIFFECVCVAKHGVERLASETIAIGRLKISKAQLWYLSLDLYGIFEIPVYCATIHVWFVQILQLQIVILINWKNTSWGVFPKYHPQNSKGPFF